MNSTSIRELRDSVNMTQKQFADYYQIPLSTLRKWEQGAASPPDYVMHLIAKSLPYASRNLKKIVKGNNVFYYDEEQNILEDSLGNKIPIKTDISKVKPQNLALYVAELFDSYYRIIDRFERDCRYDEEEDILWSSEKFS